MYAVIAGAGEVGFHIARALYEEGYNLAVIEKDDKALAEAENLDALIIKGSAASPKKLKEAGIETADVFIGVTGSDEANIIGAAIAKSRGAKTIARINSSEYIDEPVSGKLANLGIDVAISPELVAATKMSRMMALPSLMDVESFSQGRVHVVEVRVKKFSRAAGKQIKDIPLPPQSNIVAILRGGEVVMPYGEDKLKINDRLLLALSSPHDLLRVEDLFYPKTAGREEEKRGVETVMIMGASRVGVHLARFIEKRAKVILLDSDEEACARASEQLSNTLVINGSGTEEEVLVEEGHDSPRRHQHPLLPAGQGIRGQEGGGHNKPAGIEVHVRAHRHRRGHQPKADNHRHHTAAHVFNGHSLHERDVQRKGQGIGDGGQEREQDSRKTAEQDTLPQICQGGGDSEKGRGENTHG